MDFETVSVFAQTWGLALLVILFSCTVGYALWPGNKSKFDKAAQLPFEEE